MMDMRMTDWAQAQDNVLNGAVDLAFADIRDVEENADFVCETVRSNPLSFFCRADHPLARRTAIDFEDLLSFPWTGPNVPAKLTAPMSNADRPCGAFDSASGRFRPRILVESFASAKHIVLNGNAISAALPFQIEAERAAGHLVILPAALPFLTLSYGFIAKRGRAETPATRAFKDIVRSIERRRDGFAANATIPLKPR
jgi:DNA-binding transcriptional LysR family regulator